MVSLGGVKQRLHENYPSIYQNAHRLYEMTPYAKRRNARHVAMEDEIRKKMYYRAQYEARIIRDYFDDDWTVRHGPFSGMKLGPLSTDLLLATHAGSGNDEIRVDNLINDARALATSVIGCYESQLHGWINDAIAYGYDRIFDIGCAYGYYAIGFALKSQTSTVYAYDTDQRARENTAELARLNDVAEKVHVRALCTFDELNEEVSDRTLIFCDIEGGEFDLLRPDFAPVLSQADLIVETHDNCRPGLTESLARRFVPSHQIEIVYHGAKYPVEFPVLKAVPTTEHAWLLQEGRPREQRWMRLLANWPGAIEPGKPYFLTPSLSL